MNFFKKFSRFEENFKKRIYELIERKKQIGYKSGDVYSAYLESGASELSTLDKTERLKKCSKPKKRKRQVVSNGEGQLELMLPQTENQVDLLTLLL